MKKITQICCALLLLFLAACRKETITDETTTVVDPPVGIETSEISGLVKNGQVPLANVELLVYQGDSLAGTVFSGDDGRFTTAGVALRLGATVTFLARKQTFANTPKRLQASAPEVKNVNINMPLGNQMGIEYQNVGSSQWVNISGYITNSAGVPARAVVVGILYGVADAPPVFSASGSWLVETDENGYYEALMPKDSILHLYALQAQYSRAGYSCNGDFVNQPDLYPNVWPLEILGSFSQDTQLPAMTSAYVPADVLNITGTALRCDGTPLLNGHIVISVTLPQGTFYETIIDMAGVNNSTIHYFVDQCAGGPFPIIRVQAFDTENNKKSAVLTYSNAVDDIDFSQLTTCL